MIRQIFQWRVVPRSSVYKNSTLFCLGGSEKRGPRNMWSLGSNLIGEWKVCQEERWEGVHSVEVVGYSARSLITTSLPAVLPHP